MTSIIEELSWRGLIAQSTDIAALRAHTDSGVRSIYAGFDPTGPSLHAGHLVPLLTLRRFQRAGHRPIVLAGGATGLIGDPREVGERSMHSEDTVADWSGRISAQLERFVDFDGRYAASLVNNLDWTGNLSVVSFLRDVGKHFSLNTMLSRETVKRRLESDGISFTEFSYMLLQANDFVQLHRGHDCTIQLGGSDQWGNIIGGVDLVRRMDEAAVHALTVPLVTSADGKKFGKSTGGGSLWLDPEMTSPYTWYQYFLNAQDEDVIRYLRWFTFLEREELEELQRVTTDSPHLRTAQRRLAQEMTNLVHGEEYTAGVEAAAQALFGRGELSELPVGVLGAALQEAGTAQYRLGSGATLVDLLVEAGLSESKGAARRVVNEGGASVNNVKITDIEWQPTAADFLGGRWLVLRRGKKNMAGVELAQ